ncbi:uncharacterized protein LOC106530545 isoform X2 [Austrofundulus limnaeus]|uniref:Uncharacterized protein LOC106530545 isoform X2 n=1 Tax=Austrofundulus limnaeus TaxID=52670 RepID=A0A2I4CNT5_AUSLI|nr:PREDICTED: uncharacterized protein LOC106530545 isoform X2 [Austrofundulus limnaeus]
MNRRALRVTLRDSRLPQKRDSVKTTLPLRRREKVKRHVFKKHKCPPLLEEPEGDNEISVKPVGQVRVSAVPVHCRSALRLSSPAIAEKTRSQTTPSVTPADKKLGHQTLSQTACLTNEVTPVLKAFEDDDTPDSVKSCSMEPDSTLNSEESDNEDDDDRCSSSSTTLSSLPSPEIFRKESVETTNYSNKNELRSVNLTIKNSTLLESSQAENIHLHHPPDISIIIDAAMNLAKKNGEISHQEIPENRSKIQTNSIESELINPSPKRKTPPKLTKKKLISCKKVWFKSPITEMFKSYHIPPSPSATQSTRESPGQMRHDPVASEMGEISSQSATLPVARSSAMFFDFGSDNERDAFFQGMRKRCANLRSFVVFPSRLDTQTL